MLKNSLILYRRLFPFVKPYIRYFLGACLCTLPLSLCTAGIAYIVKPALDDVFLKKDMQMLQLIPLGIILLYCVKGAFGYLYNYFLGIVGHRVVRDMRNELFFHLQTLSFAFFARNSTGALMARITNDVNLIQRAVNIGAVNIIREVVTIVGLAAVLVRQDPKLAAISLLILPWAVIPVWRFGKASRKFSTRRQEKIGKIATFIHETVTGSRIVKAFGMEEYESLRFSRENRRLFKVRLKRLRIRAAAGPLMEFIGGLSGAAVIFYGGYSVLNGTSTPGTFFSFVAALMLLYGPARVISTAYQDIQDGLAAATRVFELFDTSPDVQDAQNARPLPPVQGDIVFSHVDFAYDGEPVLHDINLCIKPGEVIAIVGMTGSGKSTLVNLIPRFYDVSAGAITVDGYNVRDVTLRSLRSQIAVVSQRPHLFDDTVGSNIAYGDPHQSVERIVRAARAAHAHEFVKHLPEGYDTPIGEHGVKLSGGQRQRIAVARAIQKEAPILILDEATSALDSQMEAVVQQSLERLIKNHTTLIISHRLSTVKNADRVIVLSAGRIVEEGTHDELLRRGEEYAKLYAVYFEDERKASRTNA